MLRVFWPPASGQAILCDPPPALADLEVVGRGRGSHAHKGDMKNDTTPAVSQSH